MQDSIYHMTLKSHFISEFRTKTVDSVFSIAFLDGMILKTSL